MIAPGLAIPVYDLRGLNCPLPVLKSRKRLTGLKPGTLVWIETTDPLAAIDIPAFLRDAGHRLVETVRTGEGHRFLAERGEDISPPSIEDEPPQSP